MEMTRLKFGRREFVIYKLKCFVCGKPFPCGGPARVTCGALECQRRRGRDNALDRHRSLYRTKRLKCLYCQNFFTFRASPSSRRVTCGKATCRAEHNLAIQSHRRDAPAFTEKQRAYNKLFYGNLKAMHLELKRLSGVESRAGRPTSARIMLWELERLAGIDRP